MLGDTAVAVNPGDDRYSRSCGSNLTAAAYGRDIPVIADEFVDPEFGTGAVKVTPAHDPNDYDMGMRHNLDQMVVIDPQARMTEAAGADFAGLDRYKARAKVVERFEELVCSKGCRLRILHSSASAARQSSSLGSQRNGFCE